MNQTVNDDSYLEEFGDRDIQNNVAPAKKVKLYIYPIMSIFKDNDNSQELLTYSPNVVNIKIIDPDIYQEIDAEEIENPQLGYVSKQALNSVDNELAIVDQTDKKYSTHQKVTRDLNKLYLVSETKITEESYISVFGQFLQRLTRNNMVDEESDLNRTIIETTSFEAWKPKDSNQIIVKMGKQIDNFKIDTIEIEHPKTFLIEGLKVLASDDEGGFGYARTTMTSDSKTSLWVNPIEISSIGKVRLLSLWTSNRIFDIETLKDFVTSENQQNFISELLYFKDEQEVEKLPRRVENISEIVIGISGFNYQKVTDYQNNKWETSTWNIPKRLIFDNNGIKNITMTTQNGSLYDGLKPKVGQFIKEDYGKAIYGSGSDTPGIYSEFKLNAGSISFMEYTLDTTISESSLLNLLLEELSAVYNYSLNFKYAGYIDGQANKGLNKMALYKQEFEGKTIAEYIDGLDKSWELKNPTYVNTTQYQNFKKLKAMLSKYLYGSNIIGNNAADDSQYLLPFTFSLDSSPNPYKDDSSSANLEDIKKGDAIWKFSSLNLTLQSNYYDCSSTSFGKSLIFDLSDKSVLKSNDDSFIWQEIKNEIEESKLPSLKNSDLKISDNNVTKYLVFASLNFKNLFGSGKDIVVNKEFFSKNQTESNIIIGVSEYQKNPKYIEITGFYGAGNYDIRLKSQNQVLLLNKLPLFSKDKENICLTKIAF